MHKSEPKISTLYKTCTGIKYCVLNVSVWFILSLLSFQTHAQSIGNWTFNNILTGTPGAHNTVSIADFSSSVPIHSFNGGTEYYGENGWPSGAINTSMYMEFSLTPASGYQLDISSLVLTLRRSNTGSPAGSGPTTWSLRSNLDGFATDIASSSMTLTYANYTVTPGSGFLNRYTTVTFRLYGYNASIGSGGNSRFVVDNITVNGVGYLLPVKLENLEAVAENEKVNLSYTVYNTEEGSRYYTERSADGVHYTTVNSIEETGTAAEKQYSYADDITLIPAATQLFYRVYMAGSSGDPVYSSVVIVKIKNKQPQLKAFISNGQLYISGTFPDPGTYHAMLYTSAGQSLWQTAFTALPGYNSFALPVNTRIQACHIICVSNAKGFLYSLAVANK